jgi:hypothetical protein
MWKVWLVLWVVSTYKISRPSVGSLVLRPNLYGMVLLRIYGVVWLDEKLCICQKVGGWPWLKVPYLICLLHVSLFPPVGIANCIEKLQQYFWWGGIDEEFKFHLVSWSKVCSLIFKRRLGVRDLLLFNQDFLKKWFLALCSWERGLLSRFNKLHAERATSHWSKKLRGWPSIW